VIFSLKVLIEDFMKSYAQIVLRFSNQDCWFKLVDLLLFLISLRNSDLEVISKFENFSTTSNRGYYEHFFSSIFSVDVFFVEKFEIN
jgi:hypothetical protein